MAKTPITPEDILPNNASNAQFGSVMGRKGSLAAFLKNIDLLEQNLSDQEKVTIINYMKELAVIVIASGLHKHAIFKNSEVQNLLKQVAEDLN